MKKNLGAIFMLTALAVTINSFAETVKEVEQPIQVEASDLGEHRTDLVVNSFKVEGIKNIDISKVLEEINIQKGTEFNPELISEAVNKLASTGYFNDIQPVVTRNAKDKSVNIVLKATENPIIKSVKITGNTIFPTEELIKVAGLEKGKVFNILSVTAQTSPILQLYQQKGVVTAAFSYINVSPDGNIELGISEGVVTAIHYEKLVEREDNKRFSENRARIKTKNYILERVTAVQVGKILTAEEVNASLRNFFRTGLFNSVEPKVTQDPNDPNGRIVTFIVEERPTTSINAQINYETQEGLTGGLKLADTNFMGNNQSASIEANFGTRGNYEFQTSFFDPWVKNTKNLQVGGNLYFKKAKLKKSDLDKPSKGLNSIIANYEREAQTYYYGGSATIGKGFLNNELFLTATPKISGAKGTNSNGNALTDYTLGSLGVSLSYDTRNDPYKPVSGWYVSTGGTINYIFRDKGLTPEAISKLNTELKDIQKKVEPLLINDTLNTDEIKKILVDNTNQNYTKIKELQDAYNEYKAVENNENNEAEYKKLVSANDTALTVSDYKKTYNSQMKTAVYKEAVKNEVNQKNIDEIFENKQNRLTNRFFYTLNTDVRAYHPVIKDKNSMAYRLTLNYANASTPNNLLFSSDLNGTTLRGYNSNQKTNAVITGTVENRTYINNYVQLVAFAEAGTYTKPLDSYSSSGLQQYEPLKDMFTKGHLKFDLGIGTRLTTPIGVLRLDYAWPLTNLEPNVDKRSGRFSFGFGQTF